MLKIINVLAVFSFLGCYHVNSQNGKGIERKRITEWPNSPSPNSTITFQLPETSQVTISIFDTLGVKVIVLVDKVLPAGKHEIIWDGTDQEGKPVPSGIYFFKLEAGDFVKTEKLLLLN